MEDTTSLFNYRDPRSLMADRYASQYVAPSGSLENMIVQTNANAGSMIGNALFGGKTSKMAEQAVLNEAIKESEAAEDPDERLKLFAAALRKRGLEGYAQKAESQLLDRQKTKADISRLKSLASGSGKGAGTGVERMLQHISMVDTALKQGKSVSESDISLANLYRESMAQRKTYQMPDGSIVTIDVKDFEGQRQVENSGGVPTPSPVSSTAATTPQTTPPAASRGAPGVRITETPASQAAAAKKTEAERQSSLIADTAIGAVDKALKVLNENGEWAAGWGSLLAPFPRSAAGALAGYISQIDAQKLITQLTAMRAAAPSGASGLGSLTEKEGQKLIDALGVLRQGGKAEELRANLIEVQTLFRKMANRPAPTGSSTQETPGTQYSSAQEADIAEFMAANPGKSREATIKFMKRNNLIK
jgi:hypothetical protein